MSNEAETSAAGSAASPAAPAETAGERAARTLFSKRLSRDGGPRALGRDESPQAFIDLRDDGLAAFRKGDYEVAAAYLSQALSLRPEAPAVLRGLAESLLRLRRYDDAYALTDESLRQRDDARLRATRVGAGRAIWREALEAGDRTRFMGMVAALGAELTDGAHGAPFRLLLGAIDENRPDIQSALAQLTARARFKAAPEDEQSIAAAIGAVYDQVARDARLLFEIAPRAAAFLLDVAISVEPDAATLRAERLVFGLARGEVENADHMLDYALAPGGYGEDLSALSRLYRVAAAFGGPEPVTRALRALKARMLAVLSAEAAQTAPETRAETLSTAGAIALDFADLATARIALERLAALSAAGSASAAAAEARLSDQIAMAALTAGDAAEAFSAAAADFWTETLEAEDPLAASLQATPKDRMTVIAPWGLLTEETAAADTRRQLFFAALRALSVAGRPYELRLFPWSLRALERLPNGRPALAPGARRGAEANGLIVYGQGPLPGAGVIDRFGLDGWSEAARSLPFAEGRSNEILAAFEGLRRRILGQTPRRHSRGLRAPIAFLLQSPFDPRLTLARATMPELLSDTARWAARHERPLVIWRPASCRHLGVDEALAALPLSDRLRVEPAPEGPGALARAAEAMAGVVTVNAPQSIEALLVLCPLILGGVADFHHGARLLESAAELPDALDQIDAPLDVMATARFFYDYLSGPAVPLDSPQAVTERLSQLLAGGAPSQP